MRGVSTRLKAKLFFSYGSSLILNRKYNDSVSLLLSLKQFELISILDNTINITALNNSGSTYGSTISYVATSPNKGYKNGIIYTPGSSYQLSSNIDSVQLIG